MKKNVHIIPHMHWDREWYFSDCESSILLLNNMEEIIYMLENNENYPCFLLDGQTAILEDYLAFKPQNKERIKKLVQKGKLIIGPWYTQTDEMVVGGESIVRNLLYGFKDCKEFGEAMKISYLPDSFGQSARIPQILSGFGIKYSVFWRGVSERIGTDKTEFYWEDENYKVLVQLLPLGYAIGKYLPTDKDILKKRIDGYFKVLDKGATTENIIIPNGHDQMPIQKNIFEIIDILKEIEPNRNYFLSRYEDVFKELEKETTLKTLKGEFLDAKYSRVHRSIYSTRADIKSYNTRVENKITNILEPLASIAYSLGFVYEAGYIESIWKGIMKNHAHDSMGCCCTDKVHKAIKNRFFEAEEKTDSLISFYKRKIVDSIDDTITLDKFTAFNLLPYNRNGVIEGDIITKMKGFCIFDSNSNKIKFDIIKEEQVDAGIVDRQIVHYGDYGYFTKYKINFVDTISSIGYKTYFIKEEENLESNIYLKEDLKELENEIYKIVIAENGTLIITDKEKNITYENVMQVEDSSDDGDEYDYSPLCNDFVVCSKNVNANIEVVKYMYKTTATIKYTLNVPKDLKSRSNKKIDSYVDFVFNITLEQNSSLIKINLEVDNFAKDHRVRLLIPNILSTKFSIADNQFGQIKRAVVDDAIKVWEEENWKERPDSIYPMLNYVKTDSENGIAFLTNSVREYEVIENILAITIFRSVGVLGKGDLLRRPGRPSGINIATPDSQLLGKNYYDFAFTKNSDTLARTSKEYLTPIVTYNKMPYNAMKLNPVEFNAPNNYSLFSEKNNTIVLSVLKKAEENDGLIVRYFNGTSRDIFAKLVYEGKVQKSNLNEDLVGNIVNDEEILVKYNEVQTYYISKK